MWTTAHNKRFFGTILTSFIVVALLLTGCGKDDTNKEGDPLASIDSDLNHLGIYYLCNPNGNLMSNLCNPESTTGVLPMAEYLERERGNSLCFITGDLFFHSSHKKGYLETRLSEVNDRMMARIYAAVKPTAVLPGIRDSLMGIDDYSKQAAEIGLNPVCANLVYKDGMKPAFKPHLIIEYQGFKIGITGLISTKLVQADDSEGEMKQIGQVAVATLFRNDEVELLDPVTTAKTLAAELKSKGADFIIALSSVSILANKKILKNTDVDIIIGNDVCKKDHYNAQMSGIRMHTQTLALSLGKFDYYFPSSTIGVSGDKSSIARISKLKERIQAELTMIYDRYGTQEDQAIKTLSKGTDDYDIFWAKRKKVKELTQEITKLIQKCKESFFTNEYIPTGSMRLEEQGFARKTWLEYGDQLKPLTIDHEKEIISEIKPMLDNTVMTIKPEACAKCHTAQFEHWKKTRHGSAFESVEAMNSSYNPVCAKCHSSGYCMKNGFVIMPPPSEFASVNCDTCHGAAAGHMVDNFSRTVPIPVNTPGDVLKFCQRCHSRQISPRFHPVVMLNTVACPSIDYSTPVMQEIFQEKAEELAGRLSPDDDFESIDDYTLYDNVQKRLGVDIAKRIELLRRGNEKDPYNREIVLMLYSLLARTKDNAGALQVMETYVSENPEDSAINLEIIRMLVLNPDKKVHNAELGREYIAWWLSNTSQDNLEIFLLLGVADAELGFINEGLDALNKALELSPSAEQATMIHQLQAQLQDMLRSRKGGK